MNRDLQHIIFDFDGVIADTADINWLLSQEHDNEATYEDFLAHHDGNVFEEPRIKFNDETVHLFHSEYRNRVTPSHIAKAIQPLKRLSALYTLYIVSSTSETSLTMILEQSEISHLFKRVMGRETHVSKVEKFKMLMRENEISPDNILFITDTLGDIKEAHTVGIRTIAETFGFHNRERLELGRPYRIVDTWEEIEQVIETS